MYDAFMSDFEDIMSICNWAIISDNQELRLFSTTLDGGIIHPLYFTATHCRDSRLRHEALSRLQQLPRNSAWHLEMMITTAEMAVQIEESECAVQRPRAPDIPEWRRVHCAGFDDWVSFENGSEATACFRLRPNGMDGGWYDYRRKISS